MHARMHNNVHLRCGGEHDFGRGTFFPKGSLEAKMATSECPLRIGCGVCVLKVSVTTFLTWKPQKVHFSAHIITVIGS